MTQNYSHLSKYDLEEILILLAKRHPESVEELIRQQQQDKVIPLVTRIEIEGDYLYPQLAPYYEEKLKRYLEDNKRISLDPCFDVCAFCDQYNCPTIDVSDVEYKVPVDQELIDQVSGLSDDLEEKIVNFLDHYDPSEDEESS